MSTSNITCCVKRRRHYPLRRTATQRSRLKTVLAERCTMTDWRRDLQSTILVQGEVQRHVVGNVHGCLCLHPMLMLLRRRRLKTHQPCRRCCHLLATLALAGLDSGKFACHFGYPDRVSPPSVYKCFCRSDVCCDRTGVFFEGAAVSAARECCSGVEFKLTVAVYLGECALSHHPCRL